MPGTRGVTEKAGTLYGWSISQACQRSRQISYLHRVEVVGVVAGTSHRARGRHRQSSVTSSVAGDSCPTHKVDNDCDDQNGSKDTADIHGILR